MKRLMAWVAGCAMVSSLAPAIAAAQSVASDSTVSAPSNEPDAAKIELGRQIISSIFPPEKRDEMMLDLAASLAQQYRNGMQLPAGMDDPGLVKILDDYMAGIPAQLKPVMQAHLPAMHESMARAYAREFTLAELNDVVAFTRTPSGARYMARSNGLLADKDVAAANSTYFGAIQKVSMQNAGELKRKVVEYLMAHPEVMKKIALKPKAK